MLKPNDEYGGKGVFIGWETSDADWARALAARRSTARGSCRSGWTCCARSSRELVAAPDGAPGALRFREFVVDLDPYVFDGEVEGFLTRLSATSLANVTSGGGQVPSFVVEPGV